MKTLFKSFVAVIILVIGMVAGGTALQKRESNDILIRDLIEEGFTKDDDGNIWRCSIIESDDDLYINIDCVYYMDANRAYMTGSYRTVNHWEFREMDGTVIDEGDDIEESDNVWVVAEWDYESNDWNILEREGI